MNQLIEEIKDILFYEIIPATKPGGFHLDLWMVLLTFLAFAVTRLVLRGIRKLITRKMDAADTLKFTSVFKFFNYLVYIIVLLIVLNNSGVNLTTIFAAGAALSVGIGFALQDVFKDIIAGITILVDKSIQVNDVVEMSGKVGRVFEVKLRSTRIVTRDDKILVVPNHLFLQEIINNFTQNHPKTREHVTVGVAYGSDTSLVKNILIECAMQQRGILKSPEPFVMFNDFGNSSLDFGIYFFVRDSFTDPRVKSELRFAIDAAFRANKISIPFPQRDLHIIDGKVNDLLNKNLSED